MPIKRQEGNISRASVSGVVIAYNRADLLRTCLRALSFVDELLVVDKSSTDGTAEIARSLADRVIVVPWSPVVEQTREMAINACTHDWVVCLDDDECLSVEAVRFIESELASPRFDVYLLPQRHYILGEHDERAYYWPEYQPRFFRRDAVSLRNTVHGGMVYDESVACAVPFDRGVCIHHLSHKNVAQWIDKTNRYTSLLDRKRVAHAGSDLVAFAHDAVDRYVAASSDASAGGYPQAVAVLRATYDIVDRLKTWEEESGRDGESQFKRICAELDAAYESQLPQRARFASGVPVFLPDAPVSAKGKAELSPQDVAIDALRESIRVIRDAHEANMSSERHRWAALESSLQDELSDVQQRLADSLAKLDACERELSAERSQGQAKEGVLHEKLSAAWLQLSDTRAKLDAGDRKLSEVHSKSQARERALQQQLEDALGKLDARERELTRFDALGAEAGELRSAVDSLRGELQAILNSTSWRATAPMRAFASRYPGFAPGVRSAMERHPRLRRGLGRAFRFGQRLIRRLDHSETSADARPGRDVSTVPVGVELFDKFRVNKIEGTRESGHRQFIPRPGRRIVCVSHVLPFPPRAGNEYRIHRMLAWLQARGHDVVLVVCPLSGERIAERQILEAAREYPRLLVMHRNGSIDANFEDAGGWLDSLRSQRPRNFKSELGEQNSRAISVSTLNVCREFCPDALIELILAIGAHFQPEVLLAQYVFMTRSFPLLSDGILKIVDTHDVFSTKSRKVTQYGIDDSLALSEKDESALLARADVVIGIQPEETEDLRRLVPERSVVNAGADFSVDEGMGPPPGNRKILLVASNNSMNSKGLRDFLRFAWPLVCREWPDAHLQVVGDVGRSVDVVPDGVEILGRVDDLRAMYAGADVVINPTVAGTGLKIKTVEALCHLRTVIVFRTGADGVGPIGRRFLKVASNWYEYAMLLNQALSDANSEWGQLGAQAEALAREFAPESVYVELAGVLNRE